MKKPQIPPALFSRYRELQYLIQLEIVSDEQSLNELNKYCYELLEDNRSLAKLSNQYTNNIKGFNAELKQKVHDCLESGQWKEIELDPVLTKQLEVHVKDSSAAQRINFYRTEIKEIEEQVLTILQPLAYSISKKYSSKTFGIDIQDIIQEAMKGILRAMEKYNPEFLGAKGQPAKFTTYAFTSAQKKVQEYVMTHSRLVRLPKTKLERIFILIEASNAVPNSRNATLLASEANKKLATRYKRKLTEREMFTDEEVTSLIVLLYGSAISIDAQMGSKQSLGEIIPDPHP